MSAIVLLEWTFSPPGYFEEPIEISCQDYTMAICDGQVKAKIDSAIFEADPDMQQLLHDTLNDKFLGAQLLTHRVYDLSLSTKTYVYPDGHRATSVGLKGVQVVASVGQVGVQIIDKDGKFTTDSKRDRIEKAKRLAELISRFRRSDPVLVSLLKSSAAAVHDPNNELVHLYEVRDALSTKFGGERATLTALCATPIGIRISSTSWSRLGQLCNNEPLRQGRHRGKTAGVLRDATETELTEAQDIVRDMIEAYLLHLEASVNP